ncbi:MAG: hypothetical protein MUC43_12775 [Pirellula sp.]|jgi:hypothetical protein|nr:hypothetical protein [Pirellula sp.]
MFHFLILLISTICQADNPGTSNAKQLTLFAEEFKRSEKFQAALSKVSDGSVDEDLILSIYTILSQTSETESHRMRGSVENKLYLSPDGKQEAVYDSKGKLVDDGFNNGSYNYFHPKKEPLSHFFFDTTPWLFFGQSSKDPTSRMERAEAWCADFCSGILRARQLSDRTTEKTDRILLQEGGKETVALFLLILEEGKVENLAEVLNDRDVSELSVVRTVEKIETGLRNILVSGDVLPKEVTNKASDK